MKRIVLFIQSAIMLLDLNSCIQDEPLNAECDITGVDQNWLEEHRSILKGEPNIQNNYIVFTMANRDISRNALNPKFTLTEGAWLTANVDGIQVEGNGITRDFTSPQTYTTHSQDGNWSKDYKVSFELPPEEYAVNIKNGTNSMPTTPITPNANIGLQVMEVMPLPKAMHPLTTIPLLPLKMV